MPSPMRRAWRQATRNALSNTKAVAKLLNTALSSPKGQQLVMKAARAQNKVTKKAARAQNNTMQPEVEKNRENLAIMILEDGWSEWIPPYKVPYSDSEKEQNRKNLREFFELVLAPQLLDDSSSTPPAVAPISPPVEKQASVKESEDTMMSDADTLPSSPVISSGSSDHSQDTGSTDATSTGVSEAIKETWDLNPDLEMMETDEDAAPEAASSTEQTDKTVAQDAPSKPSKDREAEMEDAPEPDTPEVPDVTMSDPEMSHGEMIQNLVKSISSAPAPTSASTPSVPALPSAPAPAPAPSMPPTLLPGPVTAPAPISTSPHASDTTAISGSAATPPSQLDSHGLVVLTSFERSQAKRLLRDCLRQYMRSDNGPMSRLLTIPENFLDAMVDELRTWLKNKTGMIKGSNLLQSLKKRTDEIHMANYAKFHEWMYESWRNVNKRLLDEQEVKAYGTKDHVARIDRMGQLGPMFDQMSLTNVRIALSYDPTKPNQPLWVMTFQEILHEVKSREAGWLQSSINRELTTDCVKPSSLSFNYKSKFKGFMNQWRDVSRAIRCYIEKFGANSITTAPILQRDSKDLKRGPAIMKEGPMKRWCAEITPSTPATI
ncbi:unnamed protein product [Periconia digitata]|uniref:Uncharacterized protein n=1 Tax=Periconia digitata TaxID=1303443 RepID=A0A9W4UFE5_9PLEO|nr:unnamed protein product [Periconia digitata]